MTEIVAFLLDMLRVWAPFVVPALIGCLVAWGVIRLSM